MVFTGPEDNSGATGRRRTAGTIAGFGLFTTIGVLALACAVLMPEYAVLSDLQHRRDVLDHQVRCDEKLAAYNGRMIRATRDDPVLIARLMIRHSNYRPAGCEIVETPTPSEPSVTERLLREARNPPQRPEPPLPTKAGLLLANTNTSGFMILLALAMIVAGMTLFRRRADQRSAITHLR